MTSAHDKTARKPHELRAADGFGPLESHAIPRAPEPVRLPCIAYRWFSPRSPRRNVEPAPCLTALAPKLVND
ncbi:MAG: hypothetical protein WAM56_05165 [Acidobacteriaceae bacterium]